MSIEQLALRFSHSEGALKDFLEAASGRRITLILTDNSSSVLSARIRHGLTVVRLHRMFLCAGREVLQEVGAFLKGRRGSTPLISGYVRDNSALLRKRPARVIKLSTSGRHHDLLRIFNKLNRECFDSTLSCSITWGSTCVRGSVRRRTLGSYVGHSELIRINPVLDKKAVPDYFVEFIVYHEMLHAALGVEIKNGRRSVHPPEFRRRERLFRHYNEAMAWERTARF